MDSSIHSGGPIGYSSMSILMKEHGDNYELNLDWRFPVGEGISNNLNSGLLHPFKSLFTTGKPPGKTVFVMYEEDNHYYVLGSLVKTKQNLIFFPGGEDLELLHHEGKPMSTSMHIDHFTLDKSFRTWHVTFTEKANQNTRLARNQTLRLDDNLFLWFVLQANSLNSFEKMPRTLQAKLTHKKTEVKRRSKAIEEARKGVKYQICKVEHDVLPDPHVINFEFFLSLDGKPALSDVKIFHNKPNNPIDDHRPFIPTRTHEIKFPDFSELVSIRVSKFPGTHTIPWNYNSGHIFKNI